MFMTKQWFMLQKLLQSRWVVQLEQARRWGETYESRDEDDTPDVASRAHSINGSTSGLCEPQPLSLLLQGSMDAFVAARLPICPLHEWHHLAIFISHTDAAGPSMTDFMLVLLYPVLAERNLEMCCLAASVSLLTTKEL